MNPETITEKRKFGYEIIELLGGKSVIEDQLNCKRYGYAVHIFELTLSNPKIDKVFIKREPTHYTLELRKTITEVDMLGEFKTNKILQSYRIDDLSEIRLILNNYFKTTL